MRRLVINSEYRFSRTPDGAIWTETAFPYNYWRKYLDAFSEVKILARVKDIAAVTDDLKRVDGENVSLAPLPYYLGSAQFLKFRRALRLAISQTLQADDAVIIITPSPIALVFESVVRKKQKAYGVEVLGDPNEVFSSVGIQHPLRIFLRWWLTRRQRGLVARAGAVLYVTQRSLQAAYPAARRAFSIGVSNIDLKPEHLAERTAARPQVGAYSLKIVSVGSLEQMYKGADVLLNAMAILKKNNFKTHLTWAGGGRFLNELTGLASSLGLEESVAFIGQLSSGDAVRAELDKADLFILPSRTEGLPRALVEAMARSLPCLGSNVGGIPELLETEEMFAREDAAGLAALIEKFMANPHWGETMSKRNTEKSQSYLSERLDKKRRAFFSAVAQAVSPNQSEPVAAP